VTQEQLLRVEDVRRRLQLSRSSFYRLRKRRPDFPAPVHPTGGTAVRWRQADIDAWLEKHN